LCGVAKTCTYTESGYIHGGSAQSIVNNLLVCIAKFCKSIRIGNYLINMSTVITESAIRKFLRNDSAKYERSLNHYKSKDVYFFTVDPILKIINAKVKASFKKTSYCVMVR
jgi:hypothetical protein